MDVNGFIREFNPAAEATFGYSREDVIGKEMASTIIPPELREQHRRGLAHYLKTGVGPVLGKRIAIPAIRADGSKLLVELAITEVRTNEGPFFTAYLRDITTQRRDEHRRAILYAVAKELSTSQTIEHASVQILSQIAQLGDWCFGAVWLRRGAAEYLQNVASWNDGSRDFTAFTELTQRITFKPGEGLPGRVLTSCQIEWISDVVVDPNFPRRHAAAHDGLHGALALPLFVQGGVRGVIEFFNPSIQVPDEDLRNICAALGSNIGQFLERQFAEEELKRQKLNAETANAAKDQFIAMLSHELRTPLTPVLLWAQASAEDPALSAELRAQIKMVERNIHAEAHLIDDLLDISRIRHGKIALNKQRCNLNAVMEMSVESLRSLFDEKQIHLSMHLDEYLPTIHCDEGRMRQVFVNLLQNAYKFTPAFGRITITSSHDDAHVSLEVSDTGLGIATDDLAHIFIAFEQGQRQNTGGLGLGLAISKAFVELHGGSIKAESGGVYKGASFRVSLPLT